MSSFLILAFLCCDVVPAADLSSFRQEYVKEKENQFLPSYLVERQRQHDDFIQRKQLEYDTAAYFGNNLGNISEIILGKR